MSILRHRLVACAQIGLLALIAAPAHEARGAGGAARTLSGASPEGDAPAPPHERVRGERIMADLRRLPTARAINGDEASVRGLARTASLIEDELTGLGYEVHEQRVEWTMRSGDVRASRNLWVDLEGATSPEEVLVVGAHFDAVPGSPGADDNGTGVAAALELARVLKDRPTERTVRIMFYTAEEVGLIGSRRYVREIARPAMDSGEESYVGMLSLDMLGYFTDEPGSQSSPIPDIPGVFEMPDKGDFLGIVAVFKYNEFNTALIEAMEGAAPDLPIVSSGMIPEPTPDMRRSDQAPFWAIGVPAVMVTDTANFRNPHYHTERDRIETLDPERLTRSVRALAGGVHALAGPVEREGSTDEAKPEPASAREATR